MKMKIPDRWYNIIGSLHLPIPPARNKKGELTLEDELQEFKSYLPKELAQTEVSREAIINIPKKVQQIYRFWRPTSLVRATEFEKALDTPARIYYKNESEGPTDTHKSNTAYAQAYYAKEEGLDGVITATARGGSWGLAAARACYYFGLRCIVFMVKGYLKEEKWQNSMVDKMKQCGAEVILSPSKETEIGSKIIQQYPDQVVTKGFALYEAIEFMKTTKNFKLIMGCKMKYVAHHQTIVGLEARVQIKDQYSDYPNIIMGCIGSNLAGIATPFIKEKVKEVTIEVVEPEGGPLTKGVFDYAPLDDGGNLPSVKTYTLAQHGISRYVWASGIGSPDAPEIISLLCDLGYIKAYAHNEMSAKNAQKLFRDTEEILVVPETAYTVARVIEEALKCKKTNQEKAILFNLTGKVA